MQSVSEKQQQQAKKSTAKQTVTQEKVYLKGT